MRRRWRVRTGRRLTVVVAANVGLAALASAANAQMGTPGEPGDPGTPAIGVVPGDIIGGAGGPGGTGGTGFPGGVGGTGGIGGSGVSILGTGTGGAGGAGGIGGQGGSIDASPGDQVINNGVRSGGTGGAGGAGGAGGGGLGTTGASGGSGGSGGTGGAGGAAVMGNGAVIINNGSLIGGAGGVGGAGGEGGVAVSPSGGVVSGGNGGNGGTGGQGAAAISGSNLTVINSGTVIGGAGGAGGAAGQGGVPAGGGSQPGPNGTAGSQGANAGAAIVFTGGTNVLELRSGSDIQGNVVAVSGGSDTLRLGGSTDASFNVSQIGTQYQDFAAFEKTGSSTWTLSGTPGQLTPWTITQGALTLSDANSLGSGTLTFNGGTLQLVGAAGLLFNPIQLTAAGGTIDTNGFTLNIASTIDGPGGFTKTGPGTLMFAAPMTYAGGTTVNAGTLTLLSGSSLNPAGALTVNGGTFDLSQFGGTSLTVGALSGAGGTINLAADNTLITDSSANTTLATEIIGTGTSGLVKNGSGILTLTGDSTFSGGTVVNGGGLIVNGSLASGVTMNAGMIGGSGTVAGLVMNAGSTIAPGNSIGTFTIAGNFTQAAGTTYQVEVNAAGQGDRINATGTATVNGGTVQVLAASGNYGPSTTYTILNATGGVTGTYTSVTSNFAFLTPSLSYDANNVFLTLALQQGNNTGFLMSAYTPNQKAVGAALNQSFANATGDYATVIGALAGLSAFQGPAALNAISGEQYADFGTMNVNNSAMFMNAVGQQMALARSGVGTGQRVALAQACDIAACDSASPFSVWASGLGGFGAVAGDYNASTATYNYAGAALGIDYRIDPRFLVGLGTAYTAGNLWVDSFPGKGWTNSVAVAAYGSFTQGGFYADGLAGYAWFSNQLQRQISIPGLQPLTATGSTGANQVLGQLETGYRLGVHAPAAVTVAPFARLQGSSVTQNGFGENGAQSLSLNVQQQTTNSLRTLFGVDLAGAMPVGSDRTLDLGLRLGWQHEFASTTRPITASLAGAPLTAFTVYGATPQTDAAVVSLRGATNVAAGMQMYLRYDGEVGGGTSNHAFTAGLRLSW